MTRTLKDVRNPLDMTIAMEWASKVLAYIEGKGYVYETGKNQAPKGRQGGGKDGGSQFDWDDAIYDVTGFEFDTDEWMQIKRAYSRIFQAKYSPEYFGPTPRRVSAIASKLPMDKVIEEYGAGDSLNKLGRRYGFSKNAIRRALTDSGVTIDSKRRRPAWKPTEEVRQATYFMRTK